MQVGAKGALFLGIVLSLGAGVFARWIAPDLAFAQRARRIRTTPWTGALLLIAGSALDVVDTVSRAVGSVDPPLLWSYLTDTRHGNAVIGRILITALLVWLGTGHRRPAWADRAAFLVLSLALLMSVSVASHAGARPGWLPVAADLGHLAGVAGWAGALAYGSWLLPWRDPGAARPTVVSAAGRLSTVGLWSVALIAATGVYASLNNLWGPEALTRTPYGLALLVKLALVCGVLALGAVNRWVLIPALGRRAAAGTLGTVVRVESLLLLAVLGVTAVLVAQAPPSTAPTLSRPLRFHEITADSWTVQGTIERRDPGRFAIDVIIRDASGAAAPVAATASLTLNMAEHEMTPVRATLHEVRPGSYRGTFFLPMTGRWQMTVHAGPLMAQIPLQTEDAVFIQPISPWRIMLPAATLVAAGMGCIVVGLRRMGAGLTGWWGRLGAGAALFIIGVVFTLRAANY